MIDTYTTHNPPVAAVASILQFWHQSPKGGNLYRGYSYSCLIRGPLLYAVLAQKSAAYIRGMTVVPNIRALSGRGTVCSPVKEAFWQCARGAAVQTSVPRVETSSLLNV